MHIAIATTEFVTEPTFSGGLANYCANLSKILRMHGNKISIFVISTLEGEVVWENGIVVYRIRFEDLGSKIKIKGASMLSNLFMPSLLINKKIQEINRSSPIDIIHFSSSGALALFRVKTIPAVVRLSTFQPAMRYAQKPLFELRKKKYVFNIQEIIQMISIKKADSIFAPSKIVAQLTERVVRKKVTVIESPFMIEFDNMDESLYEEYLKNKKYFMFYGTLGYLKGIHVITNILNKLFERHPDCDFVFVGASSKMVYNGEPVKAEEYITKSIFSQYRNRILYFSPISNKKQLYPLIYHALACVLPSRFDNLPNTCIEAMALGKIVVGTKGTSFEQLISNEVDVFLIDNEDSEQLLKCLLQILDMTKEERLRMGKYAQKRTSLLRPEFIYEQMVNLYNKTIDQAKR